MGLFGLKLDNGGDRKKYAELLADDKVDIISDDLVGLQVSRTGRCRWFKKKVFINSRNVNYLSKLM
jgi:hypothetical protein